MILTDELYHKKQEELNEIVAEAVRDVHFMAQRHVAEKAADQFLAGSGWEYKVLEAIGRDPCVILTGYNPDEPY